MNQDRAILEMMMKLYNNPAITDLLDKAKIQFGEINNVTKR
jgi:hypothetical protein